jgi:hypothetical protein
MSGAVVQAGHWRATHTVAARTVADQRADMQAADTLGEPAADPPAGPPLVVRRPPGRAVRHRQCRTESLPALLERRIARTSLAAPHFRPSRDSHGQFTAPETTVTAFQ